MLLAVSNENVTVAGRNRDLLSHNDVITTPPFCFPSKVLALLTLACIVSATQMGRTQGGKGKGLCQLMLPSIGEAVSLLNAHPTDFGLCLNDRSSAWHTFISKPEGGSGKASCGLAWVWEAASQKCLSQLRKIFWGLMRWGDVDLEDLYHLQNQQSVRNLDFEKEKKVLELLKYSTTNQIKRSKRDNFSVLYLITDSREPWLTSGDWTNLREGQQLSTPWSSS